jgi:hypothetical protein
VISPGTAATYVTVGSNVDPRSHITSVLSTAFHSIADLGWYSSQQVILMCVGITLHCDLPAEMTKPLMQLWGVHSHKNTNIAGRICGTFYLSVLSAPCIIVWSNGVWLFKIYANVDFHFFKIIGHNPKVSHSCCIYIAYPETIFFQTGWIWLQFISPHQISHS